MSSEQSNNPLHGLTLVKVVARLVEHYGWDGMAQRVDINCFKSDPSVKSSLKFLRKTQWARDKGATYQVAVRSLAFKWIRIVYRCWQTGVAYDESRYLKALERRGSLLVKRQKMFESA